MSKRNLRILFALFFALVAVFFIWAYPTDAPKQYYQNSGYVFGTYYNIRYEATEDLHEQIKQRLQEFDGSMSAFNPQSTLSLINRNVTDTTDSYFEQMYQVATEVHQLSRGAFDITVAPLVNAWGFGFESTSAVDAAAIDSLRQYVGQDKVVLEGHHLHKQYPQTMIDCGAIAKGQGCDVVADLLREHGCRNLLVDIGGECVCEGVSQSGKPWRVGIVKPTDDLAGVNHELQEIVSISDRAMASSGNYRQFYYDNGVRRSHTIDPRTGYPAIHTLLSATVVAKQCVLADALATACMVMGVDSAVSVLDRIDDVDYYFIYSEADSLQVVMSDDFRKLIVSE